MTPLPDCPPPGGIAFRKLHLFLAGLFLLMISPTEATDFRSEGINLLAKTNSADKWAVRGGELSAKGTGLQGSAAAGATAFFSTPVVIEAGVDYFFSARVRSEDRVVFTLDETRMAYHDQGREQKVCGLIRSSKGGELALQVQLSTLRTEQTAASVDFGDMVLQKVERPKSLAPRAKKGETVLAESGQSKVSIIYPGGSKVFKELAESVRDAINQASGVEVPIIPDTEATSEKYPTLKPEFAEQNLILLGQIGNNRALWPAYNRFLTAEDGYYPGGDGWVVRTAADVFQNDRNQLILGGSSEAGTRKAVAKFCELLATQPAAPGGRLAVPWLLEVELGGECLAAFEADERMWQDPADTRLPAMTSGYGKVVRWYQNAMGYYWSGRESYLRRSREYLKQILDERAYTHQYIVEFFIRAYQMLDDSPVFDPEQIAQLDSLVLENFLDFSALEASWMTVFSPPYTDIHIVNRHQIAPWYADLIMARFLLHNLELTGQLKELVSFRASEKDKAFRAFVSSRNAPSFPGMASAASDWEEIPATFFRFALENDLYEEFFSSGLAHQALGLERFDHNSGRYILPASITDLLPVWLGAVAQLTGDGRYEWLRRKIPFVVDERGAFQGRYVAGVHRYRPAENFPTVEPGVGWAGIQVSPQPHKEDQVPSLAMSRFPFVSIRGGFAPGDDYVGVIGINDAMPSGILIAAILNGVPLMGASAVADPTRTTSNGASAIRLDGYKIGRAQSNEASSPSEVKWTGMLPGFWAVEVATTLSPEMRWNRVIVRLERGTFVFCDTFTALQPGEYLLRTAWRPDGKISKSGKNWRVSTGKGAIDLAGLGFEMSLRNGALVSESRRTMRVGEQATAWAAMEPARGPEAGIRSEAQGPVQIKLQVGENRQVTLRRGLLSPTPAAFVAADDKGVGIFGLKAEGAIDSVYLPREGDSPDVRLAEIDATLAAFTSVANAELAPVSQAPADETATWTVTWTYDGLQKPVALERTAVSKEVVDFGRPVRLSEIRSLYRGRTYEVTQVPRDLSAAAPDAVSPPPDGAKDWTRLEGTYAVRPQPRTGNYGETNPSETGDESLFLPGVKTRFIRGPKANELIYYTDEELAARHPVRLSLLSDIPGINFPLLQVKTDIFPAFPRRDREEDFALALLNGNTGAPVGRIEVKGPVQGTLVADQRGKGRAEVFVLKSDARIETFSLDGKAGETIDLFAQSLDFEKKNGRPNTRIPAGGHYMPFSFGLWRKGVDGSRKLAIGRYGSIAFLDGSRKLEGVLNFPSYAAGGMLPMGYDFNGDGRDEMLVLERARLIHVDGEAKPEVKDLGEQFWPQVYDLAAVTHADDSETTLLSGAPILIFELLKQFGGGRYVLVVRENYLGLYDAVKKEWEFSWRPSAALSAASVTRQTADKINVVLATRDGILWNLDWNLNRIRRPNVNLEPTAFGIREIRAGAENDGSAVIAADEGLFFRSPSGSFSLLAQGSFQSALMLSPQQVVAADGKGKIFNFQRTSKP